MEEGDASDGEDPLLLVSAADRTTRSARAARREGAVTRAILPVDEIVPTSDDEEREEELARSDSYWDVWKAGEVDGQLDIAPPAVPQAQGFDGGPAREETMDGSRDLANPFVPNQESPIPVTAQQASAPPIDCPSPAAAVQLTGSSEANLQHEILGDVESCYAIKEPSTLSEPINEVLAGAETGGGQDVERAIVPIGARPSAVDTGDLNLGSPHEPGYPLVSATESHEGMDVFPPSQASLPVPPDAAQAISEPQVEANVAGGEEEGHADHPVPPAAFSERQPISNFGEWQQDEPTLGGDWADFDASPLSEGRDGPAGLSQAPEAFTAASPRSSNSHVWQDASPERQADGYRAPRLLVAAETAEDSSAAGSRDTVSPKESETRDQTDMDPEDLREPEARTSPSGADKTIPAIPIARSSPMMRRGRTSSTSSLSSASAEGDVRRTSLAPLPAPDPPRERIPPIPPPVVIDPELQAFQRGRTFRTRTLMQLQPYTREKMRYTRLIKQGGRRLVKELLTDDPVQEPVAEDDQDESQYHESNLGETPDDPEIDMAVLSQVQPTDEDYDTYFGLYGAVADGDDDIRLQDLARTRLREEELERKRKAKAERIAKRMQREIEADLRERARAERQEKRKQAEARRLAKEARRHAVAEQTRPVSLGDPNDSQEGGSRGNRRKTPALEEGSPHSRPQAKRKRVTPRSPASDVDDDVLPPVDDMWHDHGDMLGADARTETSPRSPVTPAESAYSARSNRRGQSRARSRSDSRQTAVILSSDSSDEGDSLEPPILAKEKSKALKRVMPAFMAKRLEKMAEQRFKEKRRRPLEERASNEERPGQARTRKRARSASDDGIADFLVPDGAVSVADSFDHAAFNFEDQHASPVLLGAFDFGDSDEILRLSSSSESSEEESRLSENESIRDLVAGDFEQVLRGPRPRRAAQKPRPGHNRQTSRNLLDHVYKKAAPPATKRLQQMRLEMPARKKAMRPTEKSGRSRHIPPRIRRNKAMLDDVSIFELDLAAHPPPDKVPLPGRPANPRRGVAGAPDGPRAPRFNADPGLASPPAGAGGEDVLHMDAVERQNLRIWNTLGEFQLDFQLSPLPSNVVCEALDYPTWNGLRDLLGLMPPAVPRSVTVFDVHLQADATAEELISLVALVSDGLRSHLRSASGIDVATTLSDLEAFVNPFLRQNGISGTANLLEAWRNAAASILTDIVLLQTPRQAEQVTEANNILRCSWWLVSLSLTLQQVAIQRIDRISSLEAALHQLVSESATNLMQKLLDHGFHRSMRPLKAITGGLADGNRFEDLSTRLWVCLLHALADEAAQRSARRTADHTTSPVAFQGCFEPLVDRLYGPGSGPLSSEKIWYLTFGLAVLRQFDNMGRTAGVLCPRADWPLAIKAIEVNTFRSMDDKAENSMRYELKMRDKYVKITVARCLKLLTAWQWPCAQNDLAALLKSLGVIFKERSHRNLPNELSGDFPSFINRYDLALTEQYDLDETAYNLYLKLICIMASDVISTATSVDQAKMIMHGFHRGMSAIFPFSSVPFTREMPPTTRQTAMLINRYSTLIVLTLFVPDLSDWLLDNAKRWLAYDRADLASRNIIVRGLMYFAVACRHHRVGIRRVVDLLSTFMSILVEEMSKIPPGIGASETKRVAAQHSQILIIGCFRHMIAHHSFNADEQKLPRYPDLSLLHDCWITRLLSPQLSSDWKSGTEIVACVQSFLDARASALPAAVKRARTARREQDTQESEFDSFGMDWAAIDLVNIGLDTAVGSGTEDADLAADKAFAEIVRHKISPAMYKLLSNIFASDAAVVPDGQARADRQVYVSKVTKCWADCACVVVVDHALRDWTAYIGPYGAETWKSLNDEHGRKQVGMNFMLNIARLDPNAFSTYEDDFVVMLYQTLVTDAITVEHQYLSALAAMPGAGTHVLLQDAFPADLSAMDRALFTQRRMDVLRGLFQVIPSTLQSSHIKSTTKALVYTCVNTMVGAMELNYNLISASKWEQRRKYAGFCDEVVAALRELAGQRITPAVVPKLRLFPLEAPAVIEEFPPAGWTAGA